MIVILNVLDFGARIQINVNDASVIVVSLIFLWFLIHFFVCLMDTNFTYIPFLANYHYIAREDVLEV
jgi:hypothetical protein